MIVKGSRVESGWARPGFNDRYKGPRGTVTAVREGDTKGFYWFEVLWDNGYKAEFPISELYPA